MEPSVNSNACCSSSTTTPPTTVAAKGCYFPSVDSAPMQRELHAAHMRDQGVVVARQEQSYYLPLERQPKRCQTREKFVLRAPPVVLRRDVESYSRSLAAHTRTKLTKWSVEEVEEVRQKSEVKSKSRDAKGDGTEQVCEAKLLLTQSHRSPALDEECRNVDLEAAVEESSLQPSDWASFREYQAALSQGGLGSIELDELHKSSELDWEDEELMAKEEILGERLMRKWRRWRSRIWGWMVVTLLVVVSVWLLLAMTTKRW